MQWLPLQAQLLKVSENRRFLVKEEGQPFFWLGDTAWEMIHKLGRKEAVDYLEDRAEKSFDVIMTVILGEINGVTVPNAEGHLPFIDLNPARPNEDFFEHVDFIINEAEKRKMYIGLLPTWGAHMEDKPHPLFENLDLFDESRAELYGKFLGRRYKSRYNVIWILGGDRPPTGNEAKWQAMARGIRAGGAKQLMGYHPMGDESTVDFPAIQSFIDFNMIQSGHGRVGRDNYAMIKRAYDSSPVKPVFDGEPNYEGLWIGFNFINGAFTDFNVRNAAYWSVFAGGFGFNYGHNSVWQMHRPGRDTPVLWASESWRQALDAPGSSQLKFLKQLMHSRPYLQRIPDQSLTDQPQSERSNHIQVTRDGSPNGKDATYIMAYFAYTGIPTIKTHVIASDSLRAWWFNPRNGSSILIGEYRNTGIFSVPWAGRIREHQGGPDWVLVIDDASKNYAAPGVFQQ